MLNVAAQIDGRGKFAAPNVVFQTGVVMIINVVSQLG